MPQPDTVSRSVTINCGHRVPVHGSPCSGIHGHLLRATAYCRATASPLPTAPAFTVLGDVLHLEIRNPCNGALLLWIDDPLTAVLRPPVLTGISHLCAEQQGWWEGSGEFGRLYLLPDHPTPANLARHWFARLAEPVRHHSAGCAELVGVRVRMSPDHSAAFGPAFGPAFDAP